MEIITTEKKVIIFIEFTSVIEGVNTMASFNNPCAFIVGSTKYDSLGNEIVFTEEYYTTPSSTMNTIVQGDGWGYVFGTMFVEGGFCKVNKINVG